MATLAYGIDFDRWEQKVLRAFVEGDQLTHIPATRKKRLVICRWLVEKFDHDTDYPEQKINEVLLEHHRDSATLRREFIACKLMTRDHGVYRRVGEDA